MKTILKKVKETIIEFFIYSGLVGICVGVILVIFSPFIVAGGLLYIIYHFLTKFW